jgi:hypothetical protein
MKHVFHLIASCIRTNYKIDHFGKKHAQNGGTQGMRNLSSFEYSDQPCETTRIQLIFFSNAYNAPYS